MQMLAVAGKLPVVTAQTFRVYEGRWWGSKERAHQWWCTLCG